MAKERFFEILDYAIDPPTFLTDPLLRAQFNRKNSSSSLRKNATKKIENAVSLKETLTASKELLLTTTPQKITKSFKFAKLLQKFQFWNRTKK